MRYKEVDEASPLWTKYWQILPTHGNRRPSWLAEMATHNLQTRGVLALHTLVVEAFARPANV
eukprot:5796542-Amphidinium_carterae.1